MHRNYHYEYGCVVSRAGPAISLPGTTLTAGVGGSRQLAVVLSAAAPADVTVTLASSDASKVTVVPATVVILKGATAPATSPQVFGAGVGSTTVSASAPGYTPVSSTTVNVN